MNNPEFEVVCFQGVSKLVKTFDDVTECLKYFYDNVCYYEVVILYICGVAVKHGGTLKTSKRRGHNAYRNKRERGCYNADCRKTRK